MNQYRVLRGVAVAGASLFLVAEAAFASQMALGPRDDQLADPSASTSVAESVEASAAESAEPLPRHPRTAAEIGLPRAEHVIRVET